MAQVTRAVSCRTNVYKLYRATRSGPVSIIYPKKQLALYVPESVKPAPRVILLRLARLAERRADARLF